eukprot:559447-Amphidinium_carterae.1
MLWRFKNDLHEAVQFIQEPTRLRDSTQGLYKKYVPNGAPACLAHVRQGVKNQELDSDIQREYNRQRDYLVLYMSICSVQELSQTLRSKCVGYAACS